MSKPIEGAPDIAISYAAAGLEAAVQVPFSLCLSSICFESRMGARRLYDAPGFDMTGRLPWVRAAERIPIVLSVDDI